MTNTIHFDEMVDSLFDENGTTNPTRLLPFNPLSEVSDRLMTSSQHTLMQPAYIHQVQAVKPKKPSRVALSVLNDYPQGPLTTSYISSVSTNVPISNLSTQPQHISNTSYSIRDSPEYQYAPTFKTCSGQGNSPQRHLLQSYLLQTESTQYKPPEEHLLNQKHLNKSYCILPYPDHSHPNYSSKYICPSNRNLNNSYSSDKNPTYLQRHLYQKHIRPENVKRPDSGFENNLHGEQERQAQVYHQQRWAHTTHNTDSYECSLQKNQQNIQHIHDAVPNGIKRERKQKKQTKEGGIFKQKAQTNKKQKQGKQSQSHTTSYNVAQHYPIQQNSNQDCSQLQHSAYDRYAQVLSSQNHRKPHCIVSNLASQHFVKQSSPPCEKVLENKTLGLHLESQMAAESRAPEPSTSFQPSLEKLDFEPPSIYQSCVENISLEKLPARSPPKMMEISYYKNSNSIHTETNQDCDIRKPTLDSEADRANELPTRITIKGHNVSKDTVVDGYVQFFVYHNSKCTKDLDTIRQKITRLPNAHCLKMNYSVWDLYEHVLGLHKGYIKTWSQLVGMLGMKDASRRTQFTQKIKRWMKKNKIDCYFNYLLGNDYDFHDPESIRNSSIFSITSKTKEEKEEENTQDKDEPKPMILPAGSRKRLRIDNNPEKLRQAAEVFIKLRRNAESGEENQTDEEKKEVAPQRGDFIGKKRKEKRRAKPKFCLRQAELMSTTDDEFSNETPTICNGITTKSSKEFNDNTEANLEIDLSRSDNSDKKNSCHNCLELSVEVISLQNEIARLNSYIETIKKSLKQQEKLSESGQQYINQLLLEKLKMNGKYKGWRQRVVQNILDSSTEPEGKEE